MTTQDFIDYTSQITDKLVSEASLDDIELLTLYKDAIISYNQLTIALTIRELHLETNPNLQDNPQDFITNSILSIDDLELLSTSIVKSISEILRPDLSELDWIQYTKFKIYLETEHLKKSIFNIIKKYYN